MKKHLAKEHFCILPWVHINLSPNGEIHSCCRSDYKNPLGSFHEDSLKTIWNNEPMRQMRLDMLKNIKLSNCSDCYQQEANNQQSMRLKSNELWKDSITKVEKTGPDGSYEEFDPAYLDIRFNNICNFKCRTCGPHFSTAWYSDCHELNLSIDSRKLTASKSEEQMWAELLELIPHLQRVYFAGGEPLIQSDHYIFLEHLLNQGKKDITLTYNTNLSTLNLGNKNILDFWKKFNDVWVHASIDGIEKQGEYIRHGMNWQNIYNNRLEIAEHCPHVKFVIYWTLSLLNAFHLIDALKFFIEKQFIEGGDQIELNIIREPKIYNIRLFDQDERSRLKSLYKQFSEELLGTSFPKKEQLIDQLNYVLAYLAEEEWKDQRKVFWGFNRKIDRLRKENFLSLFPELKNLYEIPFQDQNRS